MIEDKESSPLVLVIDDDVSLRTRARFELSAAGFRVVEAESGEEGFRLVDQHRPDLVLLDVQLPGQDGFETCRAIRALPQGGDISILMVTASDDLAAVENAFQSGATDFATKPIHWRLLRHRARFIVRAGETFKRLQSVLDGLARSEQRLSDAQRLAHVGNWEWLAESQQMLWSGEAFRILGHRPGEIEPSRELLQAAVHPQDRASFEKVLADALETRAGWSIEHRVCSPDGATRYVQHHGAVDVDPESNELRVIGTIQDISERRRAEDKIRRLAFYDSLTGLPNRRMLRERLMRTLRYAGEQKLQVTLMFLDIDRFKWVNDSLGHAIGDQLLCEVAARLTDSLRSEDSIFRPGASDNQRILSRIGGDEFVISLLLKDGVQGGSMVARRVLQRLAEPISIDGREISVTASIGLALFPTDGMDVDTLMRQADAAMYNAKSLGRNRYQFYTAELGELAERALSIQSGLRRALDQGEFRVEYQPQIDLRTGQTLGLEALARWSDPVLGPISPVEFIAIAEESGLIQELGAWVLERACRDCRAWQQAGFPNLRVSVNLSPLQLRRPDVVALVVRCLEAAGLPASSLELELTETALLEHTSVVIDNLEEIRRLGARLALDDFGTGYASLSYLKRVTFDSIKVDRSFVRDICVDAGDRAIVAAVAAIGRTFGLFVVAEGVEDELQEDLVRREGCDAMQGYRVSRPAPIDEVLELLRSRAKMRAGGRSSPR
jgi:diguanylate cyclase (GGDEF)-like protein/PAS domain S-box-containing protein